MRGTREDFEVLLKAESVFLAAKLPGFWEVAKKIAPCPSRRRLIGKIRPDQTTAADDILILCVMRGDPGRPSLRESFARRTRRGRKRSLKVRWSWRRLGTVHE